MKDHLQLLTPELRKKVEAKAKACFKVAEKHYGIKIEFPEIRYDIKSWTGGLAYRNRNLMRFNLILLVENEQHYIDNVVPHEVAHMIVNACFREGKFKLAEGKKRRMPHGKEWKEVMGVLKVTPSVHHAYDCSSIEKFAKHKRKNSVDRVQRIMKQIMRLTEEEQLNLASDLDRHGILVMS
jgi:predicted SprT family Zn-dependent metalloprotease